MGMASKEMMMQFLTSERQDEMAAQMFIPTKNPMVLREIARCKASGSKRIDLSNIDFQGFPFELLELQFIEEIILSKDTMWRQNNPQFKAFEESVRQLMKMPVEDEARFEMPADDNNAFDVIARSSGYTIYLSEHLREMLPNLRLLDLRGNWVMSCPDIAGLCLDADNYKVLASRGHISPENIAGLRITNAKEDPFGPVFLKQFPNLKRLDISGLHFGMIPGWLLDGAPQLEYIEARRNKLPHFPDVLLALKQLQYLDLSFNQIKILPADIGAAMPALHTLKIGYNEITELPASLSTLPLQELDISCLPLGDTLPETVCCLPQLKRLLAINHNDKIKYLSKPQQSKLHLIPDAIGNLKNLQYLDLSHNELDALPLALFSLPQLTHLDLDNNHIKDIEALGHLQQLSFLDLGHNRIENLPESIGQLHALEHLDLSYNAFSALPIHFFDLQTLSALNLSGNSIDQISDNIHLLKSLLTLDVSNTKLTELPANLSLLPKLRNLFWQDTLLTSPPPEIMEKGLESIFNYLTELKWRGASKIYEAKLLIVGEPDAGKTTLKRKIVDINAGMPSELDTTKGIDIDDFTFKTEGEFPFRMNIWDFGGQAIYQSTHQFFLTKRSLYVLVLDTRKDDDKLDYWLQTLELFAGDSPIIIVQNQKANRSFPLNGHAIRARFPNVKEILAANFANNNEIPPIVEAIQRQAQFLPHVGTDLPLSWIHIRRELEKRSDAGKHFIDWKEFLEIALQHQLNDPKTALTLSRYLHDLGVFLHFSDDKVLKRIIFLQNAWVTSAIYKVLDSDLVKIAQQGRFSFNDLDILWTDPHHLELKDELLELMLKFELCYPLETDDHSFIVPNLLPPEAPAFDWSKDKNLFVKYRYDFMPRGVFAKFLINAYRYIPDQTYVWKEGALLQRLHARAKIVENYRDKEIQIRLQGDGVMDFLTILLEELDHIHRHYPNLKVDKLIPCACATCATAPKPYFFEFDKLHRRLEKGKTTIECEESFDEMDIQTLLHGVQPADKQPGNKTTNVKEIASVTQKTEQIKVLFLAAAPKDAQALDLQQEVKALTNALNASKMREQIELVQRWAVTFDDLQQALTDEMPQIVHFSGHGQAKGIYLETDAGYAQLTPTDVIEQLFALYKDSVRCVLLNACYSENQAKALSKHIPFVIGVDTEVLDDAAMMFSLGFYRGLGGRLDIKFAYNSGVVRVASSFGDKSKIIGLWEAGNLQSTP